MCLVTPVVVVVVVLFSTAKTFESSGVVTLSAGWFSHASQYLEDPSREGVLRERVEVADKPGFERVLDHSSPARYEVEGDPVTGELRVTAMGDSAVEAWGRALAVTGELVRRTNRVVPGGARVTVEPVLDDQPASPDFDRSVLLAGLGGGLVALAVVAVLERGRAPGDHDEVERSEPRPPSTGPGGVATAFRAMAAAGVLVVGAAALTGAQRVWSLRPTTNPQVERQLACMAAWLDEIPSGSRIYPQPGPVEDRDFFWVASATEMAFPRLTPVVDPEQADYLVDIVFSAEPGNCATYRMELTRQ